MPPSSEHAALEVARQLRAGGQLAAALAHLEAATAQQPGSVELHFLLANLLTDTGAAARAISIYERILAAVGNPSGDLLSNFGIALYKVGRKGEAVQRLQQALALNPDNESTRSVLLMASFDTGNVADAIAQGRLLLEAKDARALQSADSVERVRMSERVRSLDWQAVLSKPRVIAVSLWGDQPKYLDGILVTSALAKRLYPDWRVRIYVDATVPAATLDRLRERGAEVVLMPVPKNRQVARLWRFLAADDPAIGLFLCRDCDSPIYPKEANAVTEWIRSQRPFHAMRDHPYQAELMLAGMWGGVAGLLPQLGPKIAELDTTPLNPLNAWIDQRFLAKEVWPLIREHVFVHDTAFHFGGPPLAEIDVAAGVGSRVPLEWNYCRHGVMVWLKNDVYIGRSLREYGEWSEDEVRVLTPYIRRGDWIVEGGSNVGSHTLALARASGSEGRVLAFEPQAEVCQLLAFNAGVNGLANLDARCCALGSESGRTMIAIPDYHVPQNFGVLATGEGDQQVETVALDDLHLERLDLLKLDVQGHELAVLRGAVQTIDRLQPVLYLECDQPACAGPLIAWLGQRGYTLWWHTPFLFSASNWRQRTDNVFGTTLSVNLLCLPPGRQLVSAANLEPLREGLPDWPSRVAKG